MPTKNQKPPCPLCGEEMGKVLYSPPKGRGLLVTYWCEGCKKAVRKSEVT